MEETVKILVVDDDEVDRMAVRRALRAAGVQTELSEVSDCEKAIATLQTQFFDCVFLDYFLPDGDGLSLVQQLRALGITVPLVVLTGQGDEQIAVQLIKAGAHDYLSKANITPENLAQVLRQTIRVYRAEQAAAIANQRLKESEERYRLVLEGANDGIWDWHCATKQVYCNDRLLEILGVSRSEFDHTTTAFMERIHPEDVPRIRETIRNHLTNNEKCEAEFRFIHSSGEYRYCLARGKAQRDANNCPVRMSGVISDITERKQLENALRESESRFRYLAESNVLGIIIADMQGKILDANDAFLQMMGYTKQDVISGLYWKDITPPEYEEIDRRAAAQMRSSRILTPFEKEYIRKDGSRVPILIGGALIDNVKEIGICYVLDLSDRKRSEAEIVKLNRDLELRVNELQTLFDVIPIGIAIAQDPECRFVRINPALAKLLNHPADANASKSAPLEEQPFFKIYSQGREIPAAELPMQYAAAHGVDVLDQEFDVVTDTNSSIKLLSYAAPLFDEQGQCRGSIGAYLDITERKRIEEQERFLAEASGLLGSSLDYQTTLENLADLIVPQLADWCTIYVVDEDKTLRQVALTHPDPEKVEWAKEVFKRYPLNPDALIGTPQVIRTGKSELYSEIPDFVLAGLARDTEHLEILRQVGIKSFMCVPMKARERTLGTIAFYSVESGKTYTQADLAFAEDLGRRAGLAVDNAKLFQQANEIGENLRQALIILGEQQQQLRVLQRITNLLNQRLTNLPGLLQVMVRAVYDGISDAQFALILLYNSESRQLELTATAGVGRERLLLMELFDSGDGLLNHVFLTGESQLFKATSQQDRKYKTSGGTEEPQVVDLPAAIQAVAIESASAGRLGVLAIGNWENPEAFDIEDQNLLTAVGEQAAIAINNARMIGVLEEREERLAIQNQILARQNRELELNRQRIEQQNLQLIEAARLKSQFLATMSHELRTPMNAIIGFAQVLLRQRTASLSTTQVEMVERILNNGKNLLALINDILDLSKIEAGRLELVPEEFDLAQLINATIAELQPLAEQKQLKLNAVVNIDSPQVVNDSVRLRQVLVNLLSNAIKFTETGSVEISICEPEPMQLLLSVKDTGIGIAEADLPNIFEEFRQIDQTTTRKHGGTGLGLAITKSLVQMMQGTISVKSQLGQGSTFQISLPRQVTLKEIE